MKQNQRQKTGRFAAVTVSLIVLIVVMFFITLGAGVVSISPAEVIHTLLGQGTDRQDLVLFDFRLPRIILALLIGAGLAVSGAILQSVTQNELAEPGILGINTGAGFAVVLFIFFIQDSLTGTLSVFIMPLFALLGALLAAFLVYSLAWKNGVNPIRLVLVGIGINAGFSAALIILQLKMDPQNFRQATVWLSGDIWNAGWPFVMSLLPWILILIPIALVKANALNVLNLGDDIAAGLGSKVEGDRLILLLVAVALAGASVAAGGAIAFLGLVVPHLARKIIGPLSHYTIPVSALIGALLLMAADMVGKNLLAPMEIPVGVVVSILSAPYFIYLLIKVN
ncbi:FecCD family ABC transporter permease [Lentibacillus salicampi]|uniref:Iron ABC transporter permease n=1 Tax=Lentibacillus salicampi TaxID=175306 RepID=A0A4Y9AF27_9BACI|nr:iron ABC transporter permease [Lentibacillus salicampi]TFJ93570.1 iron ABC transporter permease [Lentibacillus salicampi]